MTHTAHIQDIADDTMDLEYYFETVLPAYIRQSAEGIGEAHLKKSNEYVSH